ncbi:MAG: peptidase M48 [Gammaproteobacteria bacterium]|nr:MAG: peptidase M48 [Gammaproteobacteria bacterium]
MLKRLLLLIWITLLAGCAVNPVTGKKELMLISESQEFAIGREQYVPAQQSQGGRYVADPNVAVYVRQVGMKLAKVSDRPDLPYEFVVLNNSVPNAWALPSGKIAINRGLLVELQNEAQLAAVLAHEIVHAAARHSAKRLQQNLLISASLAGLGIALDDNDLRDILVGGAGLGAGLALAKYSRDHESESDHYGILYMVRAGYDPQAAVELQRLFVRLSSARQSDWLQGLFASHPPSEERVRANQALVDKLGNPGGFRGEAEYKRAMKHLLATREAYKRYDTGMKLLRQKAWQAALDKARSAQVLEKNEALFYQLEAEALIGLGRKEAALRAYDKAISLNPEYFALYLGRAELLRSLGRDAEAREDYEKANRWLPTSVAHLALADMALKSGDRRAALEHYKIAAQASGETGKQARQKLQVLEAGQQPGRYLKLETFTNTRGEQFVVLRNTGPVAYRQVLVRLELMNASGKVIANERLLFESAIAPGGRSPVSRSRVADQAARIPGTRMAMTILQADVVE